MVKHGESLWTIAQQRNDMPVWLVAQYNPDVNFNDVRPGTQITLPRSRASIVSEQALREPKASNHGHAGSA